MSAEIIDGKALALSVRKELANEVEQIRPNLGRSPGLAVVLVGENPASKVYVKNKTKAAHKCGIETVDVTLPGTISDQELQSELRTVAERDDIDGILLQLPLPDTLNEFDALCVIPPAKDVDGLHPANQGLLLRGEEAHRPCTPLGCIDLIKMGREQLSLSTDLTGLQAVVVGRSILVGKPMGLLLLEENCTVTFAHSRTSDLTAEIKKADVVIAAVGRPKLIKGEQLKAGSIVIDVGINRLDDGSLCGDVDFDSAKEVAGAITPVPGGVGPMTIAMLLRNTVEAARRKL